MTSNFVLTTIFSILGLAASYAAIMLVIQIARAITQRKQEIEEDNGPIDEDL